MFALFGTRGQAEEAVNRLSEAGFTADEIGLLSPEDSHEPGYAKAIAAGIGGGTVLGGVAGAVLGAASVGAIPGVGTVLAAGAILPVAIGLFTGASAGGTMGGLFAAAASQDQGLYFMQEVRGGRTLVTVTTERRDEARGVLERSAALEVADVGRSETAEKAVEQEEDER